MYIKLKINEPKTTYLSCVSHLSMFFVWPCLCKTGGQWPWWRRWRWWWGRRPGWLVSSCAGSGPWSVRVSTLSRSHSQCPHHLWKPGQWVCKLSLRGITPLPSGCKLIIVLFTVSLTENIWQSHPEDHGSTQHTCSRSPGNMVRGSRTSETWSGDTLTVQCATHSIHDVFSLSRVSPDSRHQARPAGEGVMMTIHTTLWSSGDIGQQQWWISNGGEVITVNQSKKIVSL